MIIKNKLTGETLNIPYFEFRTTFSKEINVAFESYRKTQLNKYSYKFKDDNSMEFNFYIPKMGLVYGEPGLGKSQTALWLACKYDGIYLRASNLMTGRWLLEELVKSNFLL